MSRILLLLIFLIWMAGAEPGQRPPVPPGELWAGATVFLGCYALLVLAMRAWSGLIARRVTLDNFDRKLRRYNRVMLAARFAVPAWLGVALFWLNWGSLVRSLLTFSATGEQPVVQLPYILLGTLPAFAAWVGLWWSQYPADNALREQNILFQVEAGLPVYRPPGVRSYIVSNLRMQVLFTIVPILLILLVSDIAAVVYKSVTRQPPAGMVQMIISVASAGLVFLVAPEILRRVLHTQPLPDSPLRRRLEEMCRRTGMKYRDILLWRTQNNMGNAAVMGVVPQVRYILLSDLLLERMDDEQIEAVFAHEIGHVVHKHMAWFVVFFVVFFTGMAALTPIFASVWDDIEKRLTADGTAIDGATVGLLAVLSLAAAFLTLFGFLSRRFERQADVYAARTMEAARAASPDMADAPYPDLVLQSARPGAAVVSPALIYTNPHFSHVGRYGATLFASALHRVAIINNIPVITDKRRRRYGIAGRRTLRRRIGFVVDDLVEAAHNWFHGSISHRMEYLRNLSADPALTNRFDRFMVRLYCALLFLLFVSAAGAFYATFHAA